MVFEQRFVFAFARPGSLCHSISKSTQTLVGVADLSGQHSCRTQFFGDFLTVFRLVRVPVAYFTLACDKGFQSKDGSVPQTEQTHRRRKIQMARSRSRLTWEWPSCSRQSPPCRLRERLISPRSERQTLMNGEGYAYRANPHARHLRHATRLTPGTHRHPAVSTQRLARSSGRVGQAAVGEDKRARACLDRCGRGCVGLLGGLATNSPEQAPFPPTPSLALQGFHTAVYDQERGEAGDSLTLSKTRL